MCLAASDPYTLAIFSDCLLQVVDNMFLVFVIIDIFQLVDVWGQFAGMQVLACLIRLLESAYDVIALLPF